MLTKSTMGTVIAVLIALAVWELVGQRLLARVGA
jgi:hypothetical protein